MQQGSSVSVLWLHGLHLCKTHRIHLLKPLRALRYPHSHKFLLPALQERIFTHILRRVLFILNPTLARHGNGVSLRSRGPMAQRSMALHWAPSRRIKTLRDSKSTAALSWSATWKHSALSNSNSLSQLLYTPRVRMSSFKERSRPRVAFKKIIAVGYGATKGAQSLWAQSKFLTPKVRPFPQPWKPPKTVPPFALMAQRWQWRTTL